MELAKGRIVVDLEAAVVSYSVDGTTVTYGMDDPRACELVSSAWLRAGWDAKYVYTFAWLGRPIIQLPDDLVRLQEIVYRVKPDVIVETGIAHGGSLIYYASLFEAMRTKGRVVGVDIEIRPANRAAIEAHELFDRIALIEGSSTDPAIVARVKSSIRPDDRVMIVLDSNHTYAHVEAELKAYSPLVTPGSYIVACDGIMKDLEGAPRSSPGWKKDNPFEAAAAFVADNPDFVVEQPAWPFDESIGLKENVTYWPGAWIKRIR
jgi:cephalosporin hydroxylase